MTPQNRHSQSGAAAMEFALCLPIFMLLMWGLLTFGALFYTQLAVSRAAHDGANAAAALPYAAEELIKDAVIDSLAATPVAAVGKNGSYDTRHDWLVTYVRPAIEVSGPESCDSVSGRTCTTVRIDYPYVSGPDGARLLPTISLPGLGALSFIPETLFAQAVVVR